jgi:hypothetical protein
MTKHFRPFVLFIMFVGFTNIAVEVCVAMWATNPAIAVCASILIAILWIMLVEQYVSDRKIEKIIDKL